MIRRIYAIIGETDFYKFLSKAKEEKLTMGEALAGLVIMYIQEPTITLAKHKAVLQFTYDRDKVENTLADVEVMHD